LVLEFSANVLKKPIIQPTKEKRMELNADKLEIQKQWDKDPCGASTATEQTPGTLDFYRAVRDYRYNVYAPWLTESYILRSGKTKICWKSVWVGQRHFRFGRGGNRHDSLGLEPGTLEQTQRHLELEGLTTTPSMAMPKRCLLLMKFDLVYAFGVLPTPGYRGGYCRNPSSLTSWRYSNNWVISSELLVFLDSNTIREWSFTGGSLALGMAASVVAN
jgi:hypothetical protein